MSFGDKDDIYQFIEQIDPLGAQFLNFRYPVDVWNYIIYGLPFVLFVLASMFSWIPIVLHSLHWFPKLLLPRLLGFPLLAQLLRSLGQLANPQPPSVGDFIQYFERLYNLTTPTNDASNVPLTNYLPSF